MGQTLAGRYRILSKLGKGAFGQTYLAEDTQLPDNKPCVVKHLKPQLTDELTLQAAQKLFPREAEVLNKLGEEHRQIPRLLAHFEENGEFYLVQEFIEGKDLSQEIFADKKLPEAEVIEILDEVLDILAFVHQQNAIHRDIKPSNIMRRDKDKKLVLIDFGAVKELTTQIVDHKGLTTVTVAIGTPGYMPSEQSQSRPKFASDLYSLGMMAIFALTGIEPKNIRKNPQTEEIIWRDETPVSDNLGDFIDRLVKYNFRDRFPSAVEAKAALQGIIKIPSTFFPEPIQKPKKSGFFGVKKIVTAIALLLTIGGGYFYVRKLQEPSGLLLTYENIDYGIEVDYPDNWILEKVEDPFGTVVRFFPENGQGETEPILVTIEVENIGSNVYLDEYTTSTITKITKYLPEAKIISSQPITLGKNSAHRVIYTGKNRGINFTSKYLQIWLLEENRAYIMTYVAPEDRYQDFVGTVEKMIIPSWKVGEVFN
ncbi:MAG: protein kinase [Xenococcus sp. MO_188.B8]|nr:protein kinase [Xenococcus sp. MO_188.B8]